MPIFSIPIEPKGNITCTQPSPKAYLIAFDSPPDNRLTPSFLNAFLLALDILDHRYPKGVVITTSAISKFYSNGLDYKAAIAEKGFFENKLYPVWRRILTYPMPIIALLNGHAFAGGFMTAMMHDYRFMNPHRGFLCANEVEIGAPLSAPMASIFREKVPSPNTFRNIFLEAKRYNALEALKEGIIDGLGGMDEVLTFVAEMKLVDKVKTGVYGSMKAEMWKQTVANLEPGEGTDKEWAQMLEDRKTRAEKEIKNVEEWEKRSQDGKPKL